MISLHEKLQRARAEIAANRFWGEGQDNMYDNYKGTGLSSIPIEKTYFARCTCYYSCSGFCVEGFHGCHHRKQVTVFDKITGMPFDL